MGAARDHLRSITAAIAACRPPNGGAISPKRCAGSIPPLIGRLRADRLGLVDRMRIQRALKAG